MRYQIPFDLEAAKRGEPIMQDNGRRAEYVGYDPELRIRGEAFPVIVKVVGEDGHKTLTSARATGQLVNQDTRIVMAPKIGYVNVYTALDFPFVKLGRWYATAEAAKLAREDLADPNGYLCTIEVPRRDGL